MRLYVQDVPLKRLSNGKGGGSRRISAGKARAGPPALRCSCPVACLDAVVLLADRLPEMSRLYRALPNTEYLAGSAALT